MNYSHNIHQSNENPKCTFAIVLMKTDYLHNRQRISMGPEAANESSSRICLTNQIISLYAVGHFIQATSTIEGRICNISTAQMRV